MKIFFALTILAILGHQVQSLDNVGKFLKLFDLDYDDVVVEKGENWVEKYYIKQLKKCNINLPQGYSADIKGLAKNAPPDYSIIDEQGNKYYFNVCRNTIITCNGYDDAIAL